MSDYQPSELARKMIRFLDCPCTLFGPMRDEDPLYDSYQAARRESHAGGFTPVLIKVDEDLLLTLRGGMDTEKELDLNQMRARRETLLAAALPSGEDYFKGLAAGEELAWDPEAMGEVEDGETIDRFSSYWNVDTEQTDEVILARIPTAHPWEVFAWLPLGGWNFCPDSQGFLAAAKHWYERHGAVLGAVSHDEVEFILEKPVKDLEQAKRLALEHYVFCADRVDQCEESGSVGGLAHALQSSLIWYFWWD